MGDNSLVTNGGGHVSTNYPSPMAATSKQKNHTLTHNYTILPPGKQAVNKIVNTAGGRMSVRENADSHSSEKNNHVASLNKDSVGHEFKPALSDKRQSKQIDAVAHEVLPKATSSAEKEKGGQRVMANPNHMASRGIQESLAKEAVEFQRAKTQNKSGQSGVKSPNPVTKNSNSPLKAKSKSDPDIHSDLAAKTEKTSRQNRSHSLDEQKPKSSTKVRSRSSVSSVQKSTNSNKPALKILPRKIGSPKLQRGELLSANFKDADGHKFCEEQAERTRNVQVLERSIEQLEMQIKKYDEKGEPNTPRIEAARAHLASNKRALEDLRNSAPDATWASTDAPRAHFRRQVEQLQERESSEGDKIGLFDIAQKFARKQEIQREALIKGKESSLALTNNMRYQQTYFVSKHKLDGYEDLDLENILLGKDPEGRKITDPDVLERYNLYVALKNGTPVEELEQDPSYKQQIESIKSEMEPALLEAANQSPELMAAAIKAQLHLTPIEYLVPGGKGLVRSAAITDFMHGETNYKDLEALILLKELGIKPSKPKQHDPMEMKMPTAVTNALQRMKIALKMGEKQDKGVAQKSEPSLDPAKMAKLKEHFGDRIMSDGVFDLQKAEALAERLMIDVMEAYPEKQLDMFTGEWLFIELQSIVLEREEHLMEKALQDLHEHLKHHPVGGDQKSVFMGRVGLVDPQKGPKYDKDGFCLNERSQALDAAAIYGILQGKTLVFDGEEGSAIRRDLENPDVIHVPKNFRQGGDPEQHVKLNTSYLNISIAGHLDNEGDQANINEEGFNRLKAAVDEARLSGSLTPAQQIRARRLLGRIRQGTQRGTKGGSFDVVADATELMSMIGHASVNCYGGKDRTGYVCAVHDNRKMVQYLQENYPTDVRYDKGSAHMAKLGLEMLSYKGLIIGVIRDNNSMSVMKLARGDLNLLLDGEGFDFLKGAGRLAINGVQFTEGILPSFVRKVGNSLTNVEKGEGNIYQ